MGSSSKKKQTVGFHYFLSMHCGLTHGTVDGFHSIWFGDKIAWQGTHQHNGADAPVPRMFEVSNYELFGGADTGGEGGVGGIIEFGFGHPDQQLVGVMDNGSYDATQVPIPISAVSAAFPTRAVNYRGLAVMMMHGWYWGTNPYLKNVSVEASRYPFRTYPVGEDDDPAMIGIDANPAFIILDCATNEEWGMGYSRDYIDMDSINAAAVRLKQENFGLSLVMQSQQTIEEFINEICEHIDGTFYFRPNTGKWALTLVRQDDPIRLVFNTDNCRLLNFSRRLLGETVNQITVKYTNPATEDYASVGVQDEANIESQGQPVPGTKEYRGIRTEGLALWVAQRELKLASACLATAEIEANRSAWTAIPGDTVTFTWPRLKEKDLRMRITEVRHGTAGSGKISLSLIEDVFGSNTPYSGTNEAPVPVPPQPPTTFEPGAFFDVPYWFVADAMGDSAARQLSASDCFMGAVVHSKNKDFKLATMYRSKQNIHGQWVDFDVADEAFLTPSAVLAEPLGLEAISSLKITTEGISNPNEMVPDSFIWVADYTYGSGGRQGAEEVMRIVQPRENSTFPRVQRGLMDTHPRVWPAGTRVFFVTTTNTLMDTNPSTWGTSYYNQYALGMTTSAGKSVPFIDGDIARQNWAGPRQGKPLPPQNIRIDNQYFPTTVYWHEVQGKPTLRVAFSTRNRTLQTSNNQVEWSANGVTSESSADRYFITVDAGPSAPVPGRIGQWDGRSPSPNMTVDVPINVTDYPSSGQIRVSVSMVSGKDESIGAYMTFSHTCMMFPGN